VPLLSQHPVQFEGLQGAAQAWFVQVSPVEQAEQSAFLVPHAVLLVPGMQLPSASQHPVEQPLQADGVGHTPCQPHPSSATVLPGASPAHAPPSGVQQWSSWLLFRSGVKNVG
jgi:hypothetical protein